LSADRPARQWDYPNGWAPHQMLAWEGLRRAGFTGAADRLTYRWLFTITSNAADFNGTIPEKYDVAARSHDVFAEYGNVGTDFAYITREGFGWMNASYQVGLSRLSPDLRVRLAARVPPEFVFP
jgi:alpha,alpha-trehalase